MIDGALFNLLVSPQPLSGGEILAGPFGLIWFALLIVPLRWLALRAPLTSLITAGLVWVYGTLVLASIEYRPGAAAWQHLVAPTTLVAWLVAMVAYLRALAALRRAAILSRKAMIAAVWIGLHAAILPLWAGWHDGDYPSRMAALHNVGYAYLMVRLIAWGLSLVDAPAQPLLPGATAAWLLYPPTMRLGPVTLREKFLERLAAWNPSGRTAWSVVGRRLGLFLVGGVGLAITAQFIPRIKPGQPDFFAAPESFSTAHLLGVFYAIPIQVYLLLWTYNELAAGLAAWVGLRVDDNFNAVPRATSVRDFWRRWHITLGVWLRSAIYIPLGGNRRRANLNYLIVFAYCGVWHGPSWSFLAWGLSQGAALIVQRQWDLLRARAGWKEETAFGWRSATGWLLTMHYQCATIVLFCDFEYLGTRLFPELLARLA